MQDWALSLEGVTKRFTGFTLDNITLRVARGTIMGLIGENGAGKTTTLKLLLGIIRPDTGNISLLGVPVDDGAWRVMAQIGVVLDEGFFPESFTAREIAMVCRRIYPNWRQETYGDLLRKLSLPDKKKYCELSKGMRMKLSIAIALSHDAQLLILDEPTSGLDPVMRAEILDIFQDFMQDENHAILLSSHITTDLERIADTITFIHDGHIQLSGGKDDIMGSYGVLKCGQAEYDALAPELKVGGRHGAYGWEVLITDRGDYQRTHPDAIVDPATLDDIMLYTIRREVK